MSYVVATEDLAYANHAQARQTAETRGKDLLAKKLVVSTGTLTARDADYPIDFVPAATRAGLAGWLTMPLAVAATPYSIFADNVPAALTPQVPNNQAWVFYSIGILTGNDPITMLFFATGSSANRKAQFNLEKLYGKQVVEGYFTEPVVYEPQEILTATVRSRIATGAGCRLYLGCVIIEPLQVTVV